MSIHLFSQAWKLKCPDPIAKLVLLKLADHANDDGVCWPSIDKIVKETQAGRSTVLRKISDFEDMGWLTRQRRKDETTMIFLQLPDPTEHVPERDIPESRTETDQSRNGTGESRSGTSLNKEPSLNHHGTTKKDFSKKFLAPEACAAILDELGDTFKGHAVFCLRLGEFVAERFKTRRVMTEEAAHRLAVKFAKHDPETCAAALETSLDRGWTGVFPESVKGDRRGSSGPHLSAQATLGDWGFGEA
jgi:hypothetical protein